MISTSQKEHLTYTLIGQVWTLIGALFLAMYYIFPGMEMMSTNLANANTAIDSYKQVEQHGFTSTQLWAKLGKKTEYSELIKIIQADPKGTESALKGADPKYPKTELESYLSWVKTAITKNDDAKHGLIIQKAKLNSILPNLNPISGNIDEEYINLKQYVRFIENQILDKFHFSATTNIGMQGITFWNTTNQMPANVGMFEFRLDFDGNNGDIIDFIKYINKSGDPAILIDEGTGSTNLLTEKAPPIMDNPLITVSSFSIQNALDPNNRTGQNSGRISINFYMRGGSKDDISYLKENIKARRTTLERNIANALKECKNNTILCANYTKRLDAFAQKYTEFSRSADAVQSSVAWNDSIYGLAEQAITIQSLENDFNAILPQNKK